MARSEVPARIPVGPAGAIAGVLCIPHDPRGLVIFAHGSGSGRLSPRNRFVAGALERVGLATLLVDLLTAEEEAVDRRTAELRFDIALLAERLSLAQHDAASRAELAELRTGYFGASTGAAAAILAAASEPGAIGAIVSRGGRPDLAGDALRRIEAPTLLIVGGADPVVLDLNREAMGAIRAPARIVVVPGATHLFEEPGTLSEVARLAGDWFLQYLARY